MLETFREVWLLLPQKIMEKNQKTNNCLAILKKQFANWLNLALEEITKACVPKGGTSTISCLVRSSQLPLLRLLVSPISQEFNEAIFIKIVGMSKKLD
jgi:hypothetical protein